MIVHHLPRNRDKNCNFIIDTPFGWIISWQFWKKRTNDKSILYPYTGEPIVLWAGGIRLIKNGHSNSDNLLIGSQIDTRTAKVSPQTPTSKHPVIYFGNDGNVTHNRNKGFVLFSARVEYQTNTKILDRKDNSDRITMMLAGIPGEQAVVIHNQNNALVIDPMPGENVLRTEVSRDNSTILVMGDNKLAILDNPLV